jgi:peptidyl-prolyl cis-trans isomerase C
MSTSAARPAAESSSPRTAMVGRYLPELIVFGLGALAFAVHAWMPAPAADDAGRARLIALPSAEVLRHGLQDRVGDEVGGSNDAAALQRWLRAEVLYREARRLGLDEGDIIVRRRLIQKMEYVLDGMAALPETSEASLQAYYLAHAERYRQPASYGFSHLFFSTGSGVQAARARAQHALAQLAGAGPDPSALRAGDPYPDGARFGGLAAAKLLQGFGEEFLRELDAAPEGRWSGPYRSRHGLHLVYREHATPPRLRPLAEVYPQVARDFLDDARRRQREQRYAEIEARYVLQR